jgi:Ras-related protein Rab-1A
LGIKFIEASAKSSTNVDKAFMTLAGDIKAKVAKDDQPK